MIFLIQRFQITLTQGISKTPNHLFVEFAHGPVLERPGFPVDREEPRLSNFVGFIFMGLVKEDGPALDKTRELDMLTSGEAGLKMVTVKNT